MLPFVCSFCGVLGSEKMRKCKGCKTVFYCGKECQKQHWDELHKVACKDFGVAEREVVKYVKK